MRKIDLDELYGGHFEWGDCYGDGKGGSLEVKPLREHLEEWIQQDGYVCIKENKQRIQDILDGKITEDELTFGIDLENSYEEIAFYPFSL